MRLSQVGRALRSSALGLAGLSLLSGQIILSLFVVATFPPDFGLRFWSNPVQWVDNPKASPPAWTHRLRSAPQVRHWSEIRRDPVGHEIRGRTILTDYLMTYDLEADAWPSFLALTVSDVQFAERAPLLGLTLIRPDETRISLLRHAVQGPREEEEGPFTRHVEDPLRIQISADASVVSFLQEFLAEEYQLAWNEADIKSQALAIMFGVPDSTGAAFKPLRGRYAFLFQTATRNETDAVGSVQLVVGGDAYGFMGTDSIGRDLSQGLLYGLPVALLIGLTVSVLSTAIGTALGIASGYLGGATDIVIQRLSDIVANIPVLPLLIFLLFIIGPNLGVIMGILIAFSWPGLAIQVRVMVLHMRSSQLIEAIQSLGSSRARVMFRHILPQIMPYFLAQIIFTAPSAILAEAGLSFLGLGDPAIPTWGQILEAGFRTGGVYVGYWWWIIPPGLLIVLVALTFMLISLAIEPVVNPRLQPAQRR